jgi:hypothetical protein
MSTGGGSGQDMSVKLEDPDGSTQAHVPDGGCTGRQCAVNYNCPAAMGPTTLTGVVNIPAGNLPISNAIVYVPSGNVPAAPASGASCNRCDSAVPADAAASTVTDINGKFTLSYVPSGINVPVVVSVGKWRRVVTVPTITDCTTTALPPDQTRLPRNHTEGNIPKIALTTGHADALECLLRSTKLGLDDAEFTNPDGTGSVNLFAGGDPATKSVGTSSYQAPMNNGAAFPSAITWWSDAANKLNSYDIVLFSCEGAFNSTDRSATAHANLESYIGIGGRVFASHLHSDWITNGSASIKSVATFIPNLSYGYSNDKTTIYATVNQTFPKGAALATWLQNAGATTVKGQLPIDHSRVSLTARNTMLTTDWVDFSDPNAATDGVASPASQYFSFYAPIGVPAAKQCGQMVFTDMHLNGGQVSDPLPVPLPPGDYSDPNLPFPSGCQTTGLSPQQKALIYLLFDLSSCLQPT